MSESCCPLLLLLVTLLANCSISCCLLMLSCDGGVDTIQAVGVGVAKLVVILGSISGTDVVVDTGSCAVSVGWTWAVGTIAAPDIGMVVGLRLLGHCEALGTVSRTGLPDTGTTVCAPATPSAISCNACACNACIYIHTMLPY